MSYGIEQLPNGYKEYEEYQQQYDNYTDDMSPMAVHQCNVCNKIFVNYKGLQQHSIIHTDAKPYVCEICGRGFRFKSNMFEHRSVHTGFTPHHCPFCGKNFRLKGNMKKHMRTHVANKDELEAAYRPYASNRRSSQVIPENAIIVRGCAVPYYASFKTKNGRELQLGKNPSRWIKQLCNNELIPSSQIDEKVMRIEENIFGDTTLSALFEDAKSIEFEFYLCPCCKLMCAGRTDCENHLQTVHGKSLEEITSQPYFCRECMRSFSDDDVFRQHRSYHSRVRLMLRNREIEGLTSSPEIPFEMVFFKTFNVNDENVDNLTTHQQPEISRNNEIVIRPSKLTHEASLMQLPSNERILMQSQRDDIRFGDFFENERQLGEVEKRMRRRSDISTNVGLHSIISCEANNNSNNCDVNSDEVLLSIKGITTIEDDDIMKPNFY